MLPPQRPLPQGVRDVAVRPASPRMHASEQQQQPQQQQRAQLAQQPPPQQPQDQKQQQKRKQQGQQQQQQGKIGAEVVDLLSSDSDDDFQGTTKPRPAAASKRTRTG
jgi:hypothetical protein